LPVSGIWTDEGDDDARSEFRKFFRKRVVVRVFVRVSDWAGINPGAALKDNREPATVN